MKIAGQEIKDPQVAAVLAKLKSSGRTELIDDNVNNASEANTLLMHITEEVVYSPASKGQKLSWSDYTTLAREFRTRFPAGEDKAGFVGMGRFVNPFTPERVSQTIEGIRKASPKELKKAVDYLNRDRSKPYSDGGVPVWAKNLEKIKIDNPKAALELTAALIDLLLASQERNNSGN